METKITKRAVDQLSPASRDLYRWDAELKGFGVRCRPSGAKYYVLKMRVGGRQRWITIGRHGSPWTPDQARAEALRQLGLKAAGKDPASERDHQRGVITVAELGSRFLTGYVPQHCKQSTAFEYQRASTSSTGAGGGSGCRKASTETRNFSSNWPSEPKSAAGFD